jgi:hypothetical protein
MGTRSIRQTPMVYCPSTGSVKVVFNVSEVIRLAGKTSSLLGPMTASPRLRLPEVRAKSSVETVPPCFVAMLLLLSGLAACASH